MYREKIRRNFNARNFWRTLSDSVKSGLLDITSGWLEQRVENREAMLMRTRDAFTGSPVISDN